MCKIMLYSIVLGAMGDALYVLLIFTSLWIIIPILRWGNKTQSLYLGHIDWM